MLQCPACSKASAEVKFDGYHIRVEGSLILGEDGLPAVVGPLVVTCCVKPGHEFAGINVKVTCASCGHAAHISKFTRVLVCPLTGQVADTTMDLPAPVGSIQVHHSAVDEARRVFTASALDARNEAALNVFTVAYLLD